MSRIGFFYLLPYFGSLATSSLILIYVWSKRKANGSIAFLCYILGHALYTLGHILELVSPELEAKMLWQSFQWVTSCISIIAFPIFATQFAGYKFKYRHLYFGATLVVPLLFAGLVATAMQHNLVFRNLSLAKDGPFSVLVYDYTPVLLAFNLYVYLAAIGSCVILAIRMKRAQNLYRAQTLTIILGVLIPLSVSIISLMGVQITLQRDSTPITMAVSNLIIVWGIYSYQIFEVEPIARDKVFEALVEPLVILDNKNFIVDINSSMLALLGKSEQEVVGKQARDIFQDFPIPIKSYTSVTYARAEAEFKIGGRSVHYELTVWPLYNNLKELTGRIYISHDITALKELENDLRTLNAELEDRVQARTRDLAEAYESMLEGLARALELRDKETEGHSRRVTETALKIAFNLGINGDALEDIRSGAILHDIGKISIPDEILHKPGKLTPEERIVIEQHPETAFKLLSRIPFMSKAIEIPYCHHEKWDGTGYPRKLIGEAIPLSARIFAIADVWDALSNDRPYNQAWPREQIVSYFKEQSGRHFDPYITKIFLGMVEKGEI